MTRKDCKAQLLGNRCAYEAGHEGPHWTITQVRDVGEANWTMTFGDALDAMRGGAAVTRPGWNGKGMLIYLEIRLPAPFLPTFCIRNASGETQPGWLPSQADLLAFDWELAK